jgi:hypothetical protein
MPSKMPLIKLWNKQTHNDYQQKHTKRKQKLIFIASKALNISITTKK